MKFINNLALVFLTFALALGMTSCKKDDPHVDIIAVSSCSPDLLQFVTPTLTITGSNGESQSSVLSPSDYKESDKGGSIEINVTINGETSSISSTTTNYIATATKRFDEEIVSGEIEISYTLKDNVILDKDRYVFFHGVGYDYKVSNDGMTQISDGDFVKPIAYEVSKGDVQAYLSDLSTKSDITTFRITVPHSK